MIERGGERIVSLISQSKPMPAIFGVIYLLLFFSYILIALFVIYHIFRYSLKRGSAFFGATLFSSVFLVLLITNTLLFLSLPFDELFAHFSQ